MSPLAGGVLAFGIGPVQFDRALWLWLIPICWVLALWIGRSSLSGLGTATRRAALGVRLVVIALVAMALAEPHWRRQSKNVAVTAIVDISRSVPLGEQARVDRFIEQAVEVHKKDEDSLGLVTVGAEARVQALPSRRVTTVDRHDPGPTEGTDLGAGVRMAMAVRPQDAAYRLLLFSDGNETAGSLLQAAESAKALGVPIDVVPVRFRVEDEVVVDQLVAPATARKGETIHLRVGLTATSATRGRLSILHNGEPIRLDPQSDDPGAVVELRAGQNFQSVQVPVSAPGPQRFRAIFEPLAGQRGDTLLENNEALAVTFVSAEGRVLVVSRFEEEARDLVRVLDEAIIASDVATPEHVPRSLEGLAAYDAILLVNEPAYDFSHQSQEELRRYVHDGGGGLVMVGGPDSFGAGGWIGSPLEDALPIRLDPPHKRQMPRGALVLINHSVEMPDGVTYGRKTAEAAVDALSRLDLAGIVEFGWPGGVQWVHPLSEVGDGTAIKQAINRMQFGDMPDYVETLELALKGLSGVEAGTRHVILISDGDAAVPSAALLRRFRNARITISTVGVYPHSTSDLARLRQIADGTGGTAYEITTQAGLGNIVQIFIKEAQTVKRSLIWEGEPFVPAISGVPSEAMRGVSGVPPIRGYVVGAEREGLSLVTLRGKENDPILAQWQYGLGKVVAYTSDATTRWSPSWVAWPGFRSFWEQHVRWAMRPSASGSVRTTLEKVGERTRVIVEALDPEGERLNFAVFKGRVAGPGSGAGAGQDVDLRQVAPGRYEGTFDSAAPGSYVMSLRYAAPRPGGGPALEGSVQAATSRPFSDEFRALSDNEPLLRQVAAITGGRVLEWDARLSHPWSRDGVSMPVATRPIWWAVALAAIGLFLADVGVRRVRIDVPALARAVARSLRMSREKAGMQMDALRAARREAQRKTAATAADSDAGQQAAATAGVKFEATEAQLRGAGKVVTDVEPAPAVRARAPEAVPAGKEEGFSRLKKAKQRARDEMDEDEPGR